MLFSGITFLYFFFPFTAIYFILPQKYRNAFLLFVSLVFYFSGEPFYVLLLIFSSISDWLHSLYIVRHRDKKSSKYALISSIVINVLMLGFFKYADFFISAVNSLLNVNIPLLNVPLPIGISFFTFQTMSYTIDVYRGKAKFQKNITSFFTYVCLFPQLIAGPIVRYTDIENELNYRNVNAEKISSGLLRFCVGLGKKVLIANLMGEVCANFLSSGDKSILYYWIYILAFTMQLYFDFSGYSDMAIGLGKIYGFEFPENFNYPYISRSVTEFWRRWHMTLGGWFRDYVYIPLGGNRVSPLKWARNIFIVWFLTGFWHGADWNFIIWGLYFGIILAIEKIFLKKYIDKLPKIFRHIYTLFIIIISFTIFNANGLNGVITDIKGLFGGLDIPLISTEALYNLKSYALIFIFAFIGSTPLPKRLWQKLPEKAATVLEPLVAVLLLTVSTAFIINGSFNPFLYFRF